MRRHIVVAMVVAMVGLFPLVAQAQPGCSTIEGRAVLDFGVGEGSARLLVGGVEQTVTFFAAGFEATSPNTADFRFVWLFEEGTLVVVEHSSPVPIGGPFVSFDSPVDIRQGGSGGMQWTGIANLDAGVARFAVTGEICFER